ncbi:thioredoxin family protein [Aliterella atlantica]|uniref:Thiol:disulfide interchange protein n=1 Tax=Aliterella atlantica CENA595 TaxID=1618023 RepID=A0A0D8ZVL2_9CYAN|nr:thioredoxin family protein [Aliterella atlantica]KJH72770.1 thiol:disulfide interchange protein [Aliterella atlantica CENA595]
MTENVGQPAQVSVGAKVRNLLIVLVAVALSVALFLGLKTQGNTVSLATLDEQSTPLEVALSNGKPTLMEFYANWCSSCQAMAPDIAQLEKDYDKSVNFVMLNVDNTKWLPEILKYRVDGIPHFVFMGKDGNAIAQTVGKQPRTIMSSNLDALIAESPLPYAQSNRGQVSKFSAPAAPNSDDPRLHSGQSRSAG